MGKWAEARWCLDCEYDERVGGAGGHTSVAAGHHDAREAGATFSQVFQALQRNATRWARCKDGPEESGM